MTQTQKQHLGFILLLAFIASVGPFSIDTYLPSLPAIAQDFSVSSAFSAHSVSSFFIGLAIGQLISGPLSDRFGRKTILIIGFALFILATVACALAPTIEVLIFARVLQGLAASASPAAGRAIIRDLWSGDQAAKAMSYVAMAMAVAPLIAPLLGGVILGFADWRMIFWALCLFGALALLLIITFLPESHTADRRQGIKLTDYFLAYGAVLKNKQSWAYLLAGGLASSSMFAYITGSPSVYIEILGVEPKHFGFLFGINVIGLFLGNWLNSQLVERYGYHRLLALGTIISILGACFLLYLSYQQEHTICTMVIGLFITIAPVSFVSSNANVGILNLFPQNAGAASAVFGVAQFGFGGLASLLVGFLFTGTDLAMSQTIMLTAIGSAIAAIYLWLNTKD